MTASPKLFNAAAAAMLLSLGAAGYWVVDRLRHPALAPAVTANAMAGMPERATFVALTPEMVARAGIASATVRSGPIEHTFSSPGVVEPNAYRQTIISALAGGTVTAVRVGLGDSVRNGQIVAEMFTEDFAEAEHMLLNAQAGLGLAERRRERSEKLAAIGGVSQQEVDDARVEEARQLHAVDEATARLRLLGPVTAPAAGVVTKRDVNAGQNVSQGGELMTISDLSTVWVMAEVYERDLASVRVGTIVRVMSKAYPDEIFSGRVTYLDAQISTETRTLKARVELANPRRKLRFGMLVEAEFRGAASTALLIPRVAVQQIGDRRVVFVANASTPGRFDAREVQIGVSSGEDVEVKSGVSDGERVVTDGSFALRAEWTRKGGG